jgi:hypothetical protein
MGMELLVSTSARGVGTVTLVVFALIAFPIALALLGWDYYRRQARRRPHRRPRARRPEILPRRPRVVRRGGRRR